MTIFSFGLAAPSDAKVSYGCRAIDYRTVADVPGNRQTFRYETREELTTFVNRMNEILGEHVANFAIKVMNELSENGKETYEPTVVYSDGELTVMCLRSGGYLHVGAWPTVAEVTENDYVSDCETCGDPIDYCQGHGQIT